MDTDDWLNRAYGSSPFWKNPPPAYFWVPRQEFPAPLCEFPVPLHKLYAINKSELNFMHQFSTMRITHMEIGAKFTILKPITKPTSDIVKHQIPSLEGEFTQRGGKSGQGFLENGELEYPPVEQI